MENFEGWKKDIEAENLFMDDGYCIFHHVDCSLCPVFDICNHDGNIDNCKKCQNNFKVWAYQEMEWVPEIGENYYTVKMDGSIEYYGDFNPETSKHDLLIFLMGNHFESEFSAENHRQRMLEKFRRFYEKAKKESDKRWRPENDSIH